MSILKKHGKKNIRFKKGDLIVYEPSEIQYEDIRELLQQVISVDENLNAKGEINYNLIKYFMRELTSIGVEIDDYTEQELNVLIEEGDRDLKLFIREIKKLIEEIVEDMQYEYYEFVDTMSKMVNLLNSKEEEAKVKDKFNKLFKKKGIDITIDEFITLKDNPTELQKKLTKKRKK